jgi:hypothetical protein
MSLVAVAGVLMAMLVAVTLGLMPTVAVPMRLMLAMAMAMGLDVMLAVAVALCRSTSDQRRRCDQNTADRGHRLVDRHLVSPAGSRVWRLAPSDGLFIIPIVSFCK